MGLNTKKRIHIHNSAGRLVPTKPIHVGTEDAPVAMMKSIPITWPFRPMDLLGPFPPAKGG